MSTFLSPIQNWLFNKICLQNDLVEYILSLNEKENWIENLRERADSQYGILERKHLESIVDLNHIHEWMEERIELVENKLAFVVTELSKEGEEVLDKMLSEISIYGEKYSAKGKNAKEIFKHLDDLLLDGMPMDQVNQEIKTDGDKVVWEHDMNKHKPYWDRVKGNVDLFYLIRQKLMEGVLKDSGYELKQFGKGVYSIEKVK